MTTYKALSMDEQISLQRENDELKAKAEDNAAFNNPEDCWVSHRALEQKNEELRAHNARLRMLLDSVKHYLADINHGVERSHTTEHMIIHDLENAFFDSPAQSLQAIKAAVEEEVIERCKAEAAKYYGAGAGSIGLRAMQRKYS